MVRGKKQWALIWWIDEGKKDVIELNKLNVKDRRVNCVTKLKWGLGKNASYSNAKVIAIEEDKHKLEEMLLTEEGTVADSSTKIFSRQVISDRKDLLQQEKMLESIKKSNLRKRDNKIKSDPSIFERFAASSPKKLCKQTRSHQNYTQVSGAYDEIKKIEAPKSSKIRKSRSASVDSEFQWSKLQNANVQSLQRNVSYSGQSLSSQHGKLANVRFGSVNHSDVASELNENNQPPRAGMVSNVQYQHTDMHNAAGQIQNHQMYQGHNSNDYNHYQRTPNFNCMSSPQLQYPMRSQSIGPQPGYGFGNNQENYHLQNASRYQDNWSESFGSYGGGYSATSNLTASGMSHNNISNAAESHSPKLPLTQESLNNNDEYMELASANNAYTSVQRETGQQDGTTVLTTLKTPQSMARNSILKFNKSSSHDAPSHLEASTGNGPGHSDLLGALAAARESLEFPEQDPQRMDQSVLNAGRSIDSGTKNDDEQLDRANMSCNDRADGHGDSRTDDNTHNRPESTGNSIMNENPSSPERSPDSLDDDWRGDSEEDDNADAESSDKENMEHAVRAFVDCLSKRASKDFIECQRSLLALLESNMQERNNKKKKAGDHRQLHRLDEKYYKPGENMVEIYPGCGFYLEKSIISYAELMAKDEHDEFQWKVLVDVILLEVYGSDLADYCALGRSEVRPGICRHLLMGLYKWVCQRSQATGDIVERKIFIKHINKKASNKR